MTKFFILSIAPLALACSVVVAHHNPKLDAWKPTLEQVKKVEAQLTMPRGTTLSDFSRYYFGQFDHGHRLLRGVFVKGEAKSGINIVTPEKSPKILDGGCSIVNFSYDMTAHKTLAIFCNGVG